MADESGKRRSGQSPASGRGRINVGCDSGRLRNRISILAHSLKVKLDGLTDELLDLLHSVGHGHASRKIRDIRTVVRRSLFDDHGIFLHLRSFLLSPAGLRILLSVSAGISSPSLPA